MPAFPNKNFASSRIRVFYIHNAINNLDEKKYKSVIGRQKDADILIIQKIIKKGRERDIRNFAGFKIFDFDDPIGYREIKKIASCVDLVTTDTEGRKKEFDALGYDIPCVVLEDCLDYEIVDIYETPEVSNQVAWFGNNRSYSSIKWMVPEIISNKFQLNLITDAEKIKENGVCVTQWNLSTFINDLRKSNISVLSHAGSHSQVKSNNKMIVSIAAGVPCIVGQSQSYEELAKQFDLECFIVNDNNSLKNAMKHLNSIENRKEYLKDIQPYILNHFSSKVIARKLIKIIERYR